MENLRQLTGSAEYLPELTFTSYNSAANQSQKGISPMKAVNLGSPIHALSLSLSLLLGTQVMAQQSYESPPVLRATDILPPPLLSSEYHQVAETVRNNGFMNFYTLQTAFGDFQVESTNTLEIRIQEARAIASMREVMTSQTFIDSASEAGMEVVDGAKNLIEDPLGTVGGAVSGIGKLFQNAGEALAGNDQRSQQEEGRLESAIGFAKTKREYAAKFGVDPYSSNAVLQEHLDKIAWAGYAGGLTTSLLGAAVPGLAGAAVSLSGGSDMLNEALRIQSPQDLRKYNRNLLLNQNLDPVVVQNFMDNTLYSPTEQTLLVTAIASLDTTQDREILLQLATSADNPGMTTFRQRQAELYANYHKLVSPIERFLPLRGPVVALTREGRLLICAPLDYLVWTENLARYVATLEEQVTQIASVSAKTLWITGNTSPLTRQQLGQRGWEIRERVLGR